MTQADIIAKALRPLAPGGGFVTSEVPLLNALGASWQARLDALAKVAVAPSPASPASRFVLGTHSREQLSNVKTELRKTVELAITVSTVDFRVQQGERTLAQQKAAVAAGNSRTLKSKHLPQADGSVWAVDLVRLNADGSVDWTFNHYAGIALAMDLAATRLGYAAHIRWGCAWDRVLADFGTDAQSYLDEAAAYAKRHAGSDLLDAPHFEWVP